MPSAYQPNIVFVLTDQQRYDTIAALGFDYMDTPNLDRLVNEGTTFTNCFITAPSCCPSRASLFQGYYPHTTGVYKNGDTWTTTWVSDLADAGYRCVNVGKMHTVPFTTPAGFHERYVVENKDRYLEGRYFFDEWDRALRARGLVKQQRELYRLRDDYRTRMGAFTWDTDADMQSDAFVGGMAAWWTKTYPIKQPLFMQIGFPGPHPPYDPTPAVLDRYLKKNLPLKSWSREEIDAQPEPMRALRRHMIDVDHDSIVHLDSPTREQIHHQRAAYLANVTMIDTQVGAIMTALADQDMLDDTVIVFSSDHGDGLCDHGQSQKWTMYEEIVHVPAMIWMGKTVRDHFGGPAPGTKVDSLVSLFDLGPTMLELAGVARDPQMEAISLLPLLGFASGVGDGGTPPERVESGTTAKPGEAVAVSDSVWDVSIPRPAYVNRDGSREYVFAEHGRDNILEGTSVMTMVRDPRWKLIVYDNDEHGQLFDLQSDPDERRNLWNDSAAADERRRLESVLATWYRESLYQTRARRRR